VIHGGSTSAGAGAGGLATFGRRAAVREVAMFREVAVYEIREVLRLWVRGEGPTESIKVPRL